MTQEDKELLYKDLCARLPYHPQIHIYNDSWEGVMIGEFENTLYSHHLDAFWCDRIEILPYLRPLSSMTEEERKIYIEISSHLCGEIAAKTMIDWLNTHHFDYRGLIEKGLAIEVTEDNNPYKAQKGE